MNVSRSDLIHHKIQAAMREHHFMDDDLMYLGFNEAKGEHEYKINGQHIVVASQLEGFDRIDEGEDDT